MLGDFHYCSGSKQVLTHDDFYSRDQFHRSLILLRYNSTDRKIQKKHSLTSTNLINYTSSDNYNLGATLTQYNLTINYLEPIINLQSPLTQTHSRHCYHQTSWSHLLTSKYSAANSYSFPSIALLSISVVTTTTNSKLAKPLYTVISYSR